MELRALLRADRAVSPVIGVILMVGIVVSLMAVIGMFVLGVSVAAEQPDAEFRYVADKGSDDTWGNDPNERFVIQHDGGDDVDLTRITVEYIGTPTTTIGWMDVDKPPGDTWKPGEQWVLEDPTVGGGDFSPGAQVLVLWTAPDGSQTQILADGDLP